MFKSRKTEPLIFEFDRDVNYCLHSIFVFFPFKATWLDKDDKIIEERIIKPFVVGIKPKKPYRKLIETML